jgi:hypothetical protein
LAEFYFDSERFNDAVTMYSKYRTQLSPQQGYLADYKTAWSYLSLGRDGEAEKYFTALARDPKAGDLSRDALRDLAFVQTQHRSDSEILATAERTFGEDQARKTEYLSSVYFNFHRQSEVANHPRILAELLKLESKPEKRIQFWLAEVRSKQKEYASRSHYEMYNKLIREIAGIPREDRAQALKDVLGEIETETEAVVRVYAETYSGAKQNPEKIAKTDLASSLQKLIQNHLQLFPKSSARPVIYRLALDLCADTKDNKCSYDMAKKILGEAEMKSIHPQAREELLIALDHLYQDDPATYRSEMASLLAEVVQDKKNPRWTEFARRRATLLVTDKKTEEALPLLEEISSRTESEDDFYRLQMARFQAGHLKEVVEAKVPSALKGSEKIKDVAREANLRLAAQSDDFGTYEANIDRYLALNPDKKKEAVVLKDYFARLFKDKNYDRAEQRLLALPLATRLSEDFVPFTRFLVVMRLRSAAFQSARKLASDQAGRPGKGFEYEVIVSRLSEGQVVSAQELASLPLDKREYVFGVLALTNPKSLSQYFEVSSGESEALRKLGYLALTIEQNTNEVALTTNLRKNLGDVVPAALREYPPTPSEKLSKEISFSTEKLGPQAREALVVKNIDKVHKVRDLVLQDLKSQVPKVQLRVLTQAIQVESQMAKLILTSPAPSNLNEGQKKEYQSGLEKVAAEFTTQADEFKKISDSLNESFASGRMPASLTPEFDSKKWPWPTPVGTKPAFDLIRQKNYTGALFVADLLRVNKELDDKSYYVMRAGILLIQRRGTVLNNYVLEELKATGQDDVIAKWKGT